MISPLTWEASDGIDSNSKSDASPFFYFCSILALMFYLEFFGSEAFPGIFTSRGSFVTLLSASE